MLINSQYEGIEERDTVGFVYWTNVSKSNRSICKTNISVSEINGFLCETSGEEVYLLEKKNGIILLWTPIVLWILGKL